MQASTLLQGKIFAMNQDSSSTLSWNDGTTTYVDLTAPMDNCGVGLARQDVIMVKAYTAYLANLTAPSPAPYRAAQYCADLVALGYSDWYLPSKDELKMLYTNLGPAPVCGFKIIGTGLPRVQFFTTRGSSISGQAVRSTASTVYSRFGVFAPRLSSEIFDHLII